MTFTTAEIILLITTVTTSIVTIIGALKLKAIAHSVNSAASQSVADIKALTNEVASLKADKADQKETAAVLAARAEPVKRKP